MFVRLPCVQKVTKAHNMEAIHSLIFLPNWAPLCSRCLCAVLQKLLQKMEESICSRKTAIIFRGSGSNPGLHGSQGFMPLNWSHNSKPSLCAFWKWRAILGSLFVTAKLPQKQAMRPPLRAWTIRWSMRLRAPSARQWQPLSSHSVSHRLKVDEEIGLLLPVESSVAELI